MSKANNEPKALCEQIFEDMERVARNCDFYQREKDEMHLVNEVGCLRGQMYIADMVGVSYPMDEYYNKYIKPIYEKYFK